MNCRGILVVITAAALLSCQKREKEAAEYTVRAALCAPITKNHVGGDTGGSFPVLWAQGDIISLNGVQSNALSAVFEGASEAEFRITVPSLSAPYHLLYPGEQGVNGKLNFDGRVSPMYSTSENLDALFVFHQAGCGILVSVTGHEPLSAIALSAPGGEKIGGRFNVSFSNGSLTPDGASSSISVVYDTPLVLSDTPAHVFIPFAPGTFSKGLRLTLSGTSGEDRSWNISSGITMSSGKAYVLPIIAYSSSSIDPQENWPKNTLLEPLEVIDYEYEL